MNNLATTKVDQTSKVDRAKTTTTLPPGLQESSPEPSTHKNVGCKARAIFHTGTAFSLLHQLESCEGKRNGFQSRAELLASGLATTPFRNLPTTRPATASLAQMRLCEIGLRMLLACYYGSLPEGFHHHRGHILGSTRHARRRPSSV